jgi:hypothetical protein
MKSFVATSDGRMMIRPYRMDEYNLHSLTNAPKLPLALRERVGVRAWPGRGGIRSIR